MHAWKKLHEHVRHVGYRTILFKTYELPDGSQKEYTTYGQPGDSSASVIALTPDGQVVIAKQFRTGPEQIMYDLPGGDVDPGETPMQAAARELREETGYEAERIEYLGGVYRDAYSNVIGHCFIAYECRLTSSQMFDEGEFVEVELISIKQLLENARSTRMTDPSAILLAYERLQRMVQSSHESA